MGSCRHGRSGSRIARAVGIDKDVVPGARDIHFTQLRLNRLF